MAGFDEVRSEVASISGEITESDSSQLLANRGSMWHVVWCRLYPVGLEPAQNSSNNYPANSSKFDLFREIFRKTQVRRRNEEFDREAEVSGGWSSELKPKFAAGGERAAEFARCSHEFCRIFGPGRTRRSKRAAPARRTRTPTTSRSRELRRQLGGEIEPSH